MRIHSRLFIVLTLLFACFADIRAGSLNDSAALFGNRIEEVRAALADIPVSIETRQTQPPEGLRAYADERAYNEFERGFVVVITTEPHGWRISMNPNSLASPEHVRLLGDRMAASFKRGQYVEGATQLAASLNQLTLPSVEQPLAVAPASVTHSTRPIASYPRIQQTTHWSSIAGVIVVMFAGIFALFLMGRFFVRSQRRLQFGLPANNEDARKTFDAYTPAQREQLAARHAAHATGDILNDPMAFAMMLYLVNQNAAASIAPSSADPTSSSFPSSFDSGSSSSSSSISSSSDSSGAGGSW